MQQTLQSANVLLVVRAVTAVSCVSVEWQPQTASQNGRILSIDIRGCSFDWDSGEISCKCLCPWCIVPLLSASERPSSWLILLCFSSSPAFLCQALKSSWERSSSRTRSLTPNPQTAALRRSCPSRRPTRTVTRPASLSRRLPALDPQVLHAQTRQSSIKHHFNQYFKSFQC